MSTTAKTLTKNPKQFCITSSKSPTIWRGESMADSDARLHDFQDLYVCGAGCRDEALAVCAEHHSVSREDRLTWSNLYSFQVDLHLRGNSSFIFLFQITFKKHYICVKQGSIWNVLFNNTLNTFYLWLYGVRHMIKDHSDSERGNLVPPNGLLFPISSKGSFIFIIPTRNSSDRSDDPSHHERTLLPQSYLSQTGLPTDTCNNITVKLWITSRFTAIQITSYLCALKKPKKTHHQHTLIICIIYIRVGWFYWSDQLGQGNGIFDLIKQASLRTKLFLVWA